MASPKSASLDIGEISDWFETRPINAKNRQRLAELVRSKLPFVGIDHIISSADASTPNDVKMLDYACGPGFFSRIFSPHVSSIHGVDASPIMIRKFIENSKDFPLPTDKITAVHGNLLVDPVEPIALDNDEYRNFDLISVGAALHHFPNAEESLRMLGKRLKPGGVLFISDLHDNKEEGVPVRPGPKGYKKEELGEMMAKAGLTDFKFEVFAELLDIELLDEQVVKISCFIATARRGIE